MGDVPSLALIWEQTAPNPTSRAEIESCNPKTPFGTVQLDRLPDVEQILLLADEFKIDELEALSLIQRGYEQVGPPQDAGVGLWSHHAPTMRR